MKTILNRFYIMILQLMWSQCRFLFFSLFYSLVFNIVLNKNIVYAEGFTFYNNYNDHNLNDVENPFNFELSYLLFSPWFDSPENLYDTSSSSAYSDSESSNSDLNTSC